jgi:hypothetical protein
LLLVLLPEELNNMYPLSLATDIVCDRFVDDDIYKEDTMD